MSDLAIRVESPSKLYRIGLRERYRALRLALALRRGGNGGRIKKAVASTPQ
jgi:hypothetical protein